MSVLALVQCELFSKEEHYTLKCGGFGFCQKLAAESNCIFANATTTNGDEYFNLLVLHNVEEQIASFCSKLRNISKNVVMDTEPTYHFFGYEIEVVSDICKSSTKIATKGDGIHFARFKFDWPSSLPKLESKHQCLGKNKDGSRCGNERYRGWCHWHKEQGINFMNTIDMIQVPYSLPSWQRDSIENHKENMLTEKFIAKASIITENEDVTLEDKTKKECCSQFDHNFIGEIPDCLPPFNLIKNYVNVREEIRQKYCEKWIAFDGVKVITYNESREDIIEYVKENQIVLAILITSPGYETDWTKCTSTREPNHFSISHEYIEKVSTNSKFSIETDTSSSFILYLKHEIISIADECLNCVVEFGRELVKLEYAMSSNFANGIQGPMLILEHDDKSQQMQRLLYILFGRYCTINIIFCLRPKEYVLDTFDRFLIGLPKERNIINMDGFNEIYNALSRSDVSEELINDPNIIAVFPGINTEGTLIIWIFVRYECVENIGTKGLIWNSYLSQYKTMTFEALYSPFMKHQSESHERLFGSLGTSITPSGYKSLLYPGTISYFIKHLGKYYGVSCAHCYPSESSVVMQPSSNVVVTGNARQLRKMSGYDMQEKCKDNIIGKVIGSKYYENVLLNETNIGVDVAIFACNDEVTERVKCMTICCGDEECEEVNINFPSWEEFGRYLTTFDPNTTIFKKSGATTGVTTMRFETYGVSCKGCKMFYQMLFNSTDYIAAGNGDSGSLIYDNNMMSIAQLHAGIEPKMSKTCIATPIPAIVKACNDILQEKYIDI